MGAGEAGLGDARVSDDVYPTAAIEINGLTPNGPVLANNAFFGISVASMGDLDGDGVPDLAVGAEFDNASGTYRGAVHVMLMNADGTVKSTSEINGATPNGPVLPDYGNFGISVASMGDLDGDGVPDLAAGSTEMGAVHIMLMNADGTVKSTSEINGATPNGPVLATHDHFGSSITLLGDLDGDGVPDLAVGAYHDNAGGTEKGAVYVMLMNGDGTVKSTSEINGTTPNGPVLANHDYFGRSMASLGDLDGDGVPDLAVGAYFDNAGGINKGAVHIMLMNGDGTVKSTSEINGTTPNGPVLTTHDHFGAAVASMGDLDGDGVPDLAVGAYGDDGRGVPGDDGRGAVHVMLMNADGTVKSTSEINGTTPNGPVLKDNDNFGRSVASMGDFDGDGVTDLVAGIYAGSDAGGINRGAVHIVTLGVVPVDRTSPPPAPANLTATSTTDSVTLTWDDPDDDSITGYKILSRMPAVQTNLSVLVADTGSADNTYTVPDLESGTVYIFLIIAISDHGESEMSDPVRMSTLPNSPPVADAGLSQIVQPGNTVTLNGTGSSDPDGHTIIYSWNQTSGSVVALSGADTDSPSFEAPATTDHTILTFELTVSDGRLASSDAVNITVKPDGPPAIILAGSANMTIQVGSAYTEPGYTATDDIDGNLTANVTITGTVDSSASGTYALQYDVTDSSGNTAIPQNRTVHVTDTTPPTITLAGSANMTIQVGSAYTEPGYTATDNYDGDITKDVTVTGTVDSSASGTYALQYDVTDSSGNTAIPQNRTVHVTDTTPPTITLAGSANMTIQVGSAYTEPGYTATDNYDGDITKDVTVTGTVDSSASGTYALQYDVTDSSGNTAIQQVRTVSVVAPPPPAAPTGLQVTSTTTSVTLTWDDPSDDSITGYKILSRMPAVQSSLSVLVADTGSADNTYTVNNLEPDTMYAFRVVALSDHGKSEVSKFININTEKPPPPAAPTGLQVTSTTTSVTLTWDDPSDDSITGYKILSRMPAVQSSLSVLVADTGSADNTYTVNNLEPDTMYAFRVVALSDHGKSEVSKFININTEKPPPPAAPTGLQVTSTTTSVTLTWDDPSDDSITGYKILSRMPAVQSSLSVLVADTGSADNTYTVNNLEPDTMYAFRVVALSDHGKSEVSKFININTEKPPPPAAPTGLQVTSTTTSVTLTWDDPSDDSITGYKILSRMPAVQSSLSVLVADTGSADNTYTVNNLEPDTMYAFRVVALSDHGKSEVSKFININTEKPPPPAAPTGLQVTSTTTSVTLTWDDPSDDSITGYKILSRMPAVQSSLSVLVADTGSADNTYTVNNLEPDTMYAFRVVALSDHGKSEVSKFININTEKPPPPAAPTGLQVTSTTTSVTLTWDDPSDDSITGYKILSRMPAVQSSLSVLVADTGSADNTYTVNNLEPDTMYAFRVVALSDHGKSEVSKFININTEKPPPPAAPTGLQVTSTTTSVTLTWDDPSDDSITGYKILSRMPAVQSSLSVLVADTGSADNTYTVNNLEPDTMYAFRVVALSDHGKSEVSKFININTERPASQ